MRNLKPLILIGENSRGELVAIPIASNSETRVESLKGSGIVDVPTPKEEEVVKQMRRKDTNLDSILAKYK